MPYFNFVCRTLSGKILRLICNIKVVSMEIFYLTSKEHQVKNTENLSFQTVHSAEEIFEQNSERKVVVVDIDHLMDAGFMLAAKLAADKNSKIVLVCLTTLDVDTRASKFHFFVSSIADISLKMPQITQRLEGL